MTKVWGPHIWIFLHCFCEKLNENYFNLNKIQIMTFIKTIIFNLPCPMCSNDTKKKFKNVNDKNIKTKEELKMLIFYYHNYVNKKLRKREADIKILEQYKKYNVYNCYKNFIKVFIKKYSFKLNIHSYLLLSSRNRAGANVIKWWNTNYKKCFDEKY